MVIVVDNMLRMTEITEDNEEPSSRKGDEPPRKENKNGKSSLATLPFQWIKNIVKSGNDSTLRETLEEYIEDAENGDVEVTSVTAHERSLIANILKLRGHTVVDVMIPRADIFAIDVNTSQKELLSLLSEKQHSRIPVYQESLDNIIGTIHIKDIMGFFANDKNIDNIKELIREAPIVSPSMQVLDLLLMMKQIRKHMALVVDEFGGIDGLVTINDVIESIVGEIEDEYDQDDRPQIIKNDDGTLLADARLDIEEFEEKYGQLLSAEERDDIETLGGLVFALAGRVPARGEILTHPSGMVFEILDADPRRVNRLRIKNIPLL